MYNILITLYLMRLCFESIEGGVEYAREGGEEINDMINPLFDGNRVNLILQTAIDGYAARHKSIVNNIANVDTPGYQRIEVSFEADLKKAVRQLRETDQSEDSVDDERMVSRMRRVVPEVSIDGSKPLRADGSNVSIDREMANLAKNAGKMNALTEIMIRNYRDIKTAIKGN